MKSKRKSRPRSMKFEALETRNLLASVWQNPIRQVDVNNDGHASPIDALLVINRLNDSSLEPQLGPRTNPLSPYLDTNGDKFITPIDALTVINVLNAQREDPVYPVVRRPGGSEGGPAGFISHPLMKLPGEAGELMEVTLNWASSNVAFHEAGIFAISEPNGRVANVDSRSQDYPVAAYSAPDSQVLFSRQGLAVTENSAVFEGGQWVSIYFLQQASAFGEPTEHIDVQVYGDDSFEIRWQEQKLGSAPFKGLFNDSVLLGSIRPLNLNPSIDSSPITIVDTSSNYKYAVQASDPEGSNLSFELLAGPTGMSIDQSSGIISWSAEDSFVGGHYVELQVHDPSGGFKKQSFQLEVVESLPNRPPVILSAPDTSVQLDPTSVQFQEETLVFNDWSRVEYDFHDRDDADWYVDGAGQRVKQRASFDPTFLLSDFELSNHRFEGQLDSNYVFGGGFVGLVFGYEDESNFFLFDWIQSDYDYPPWLTRRGMSVKQFSSSETLVETDFWQTDVRPEVGSLLFHNDFNNEVNLDRSLYTLTLEQTAGRVRIVIASGDTVLETIKLVLPELQGGKVGFYTNYQNSSTYQDFTLKPFGGDQYRYNINATDADGDSLTYQLAESPRDMLIDSQTGEITWQPSFKDVGDHSVSVVITDGRGGETRQDFVICVSPTKTNIVPQIISIPITDHNSGDYKYVVKAFDPENDALTFELVEAPFGMRIHPDSGEIFWAAQDFGYAPGAVFDAPRSFYAGSGRRAPITISVTDSHGGQAVQSFDLFVYGSDASSIAGYVFDDLNQNGLLDSNLIVGDTPYIVFVVDPSDSMGDYFRGQSVGDRNRDGFSDTLFDASLHAVELAINHLLENLDEVEAQVSVVSFGELYDMNPALPGHQSFVGITDDHDNDGVRDAIQSLSQVWWGGINSAFDLGLQSAIKVFEQEASHSNSKNLLFFSDGFHGGLGSGNFDDEVETLRQMNVSMQAFGMNGHSTDSLEIIDPDPLEVRFSGDLLDAFDGLNPNGFEITEPTLAGWTVFLDRNENGLLDADEPVSLTDDAGRYQFDLPAAGVYHVRALPTEGWRQTAPNTGAYATILIGGDHQNVSHFGFVRSDTSHDNTAPAFLHSPPPYAQHGSTYEFDAFAFDADGGPVSYRLVVGPSNASLHPSLGKLFWKPNVGDVGQHNFVLVATDDGGAQTRLDFKVNVTAPTPPLTVISDAPAAWPTGVETNYQIQLANDPAGVQFELLSGPADLKVDPNSGRVTWSPDNSYPGIVMSDGPLAYWRFEEASGSTLLRDSSGSGFHAVSSLPIQSIPTSPAAGASIETTRDTYISVPTGTGIILSELTIEGWFKSSPDGNNTWIASVFNDVGGSFDLNQGSFLWHGLSFAGVGVELQPPFDVWYHVVGTYSATEGRHFYMNGELVASSSTVITDPDSPYEIGLTWGWAGQMDEVAIYGYPLSAAQIQSHYHQQIQPRQMASIAITDLSGQTIFHDLELDVRNTNVNNAPVFSNSLPQSIGIGQHLLHQVDAIDDAGEVAGYTLENSPTGMTIDGAGLLSWIPAADHIGTHSFQIEVTDNQGLSTIQDVLLQVLVSLPFESLEITSVPPAQAVVGEVFEYDARTDSSRGMIWSLEEAPTDMLIDGATGRLRWGPGVNDLGSIDVVISVTDGLRVAYQRFSLDVSCHNFAPRIESIPNVRATVDIPYSYSVFAADPDKDLLSWELLQSPVGMSIDTSGTISWTPAEAQIGQHVVIVSVSDGINSTSQAFAIQALSPQLSNRAPVILSSPVYFAETDVEYQYQIKAIDPEGGALTYSFLGDVPDGVEIVDLSTIRWIPSSEQVGTHSIGIQVMDQFGLSSNQLFLVEISSNLFPVVTSTPPQGVPLGGDFRYLIKAYDPEGDRLSYRLVEAPLDAKLDAAGGVKWKTPLAAPSENTFKVGISDESGRETIHEWSVSPVADTEPPVAGIVIFAGGRRVQIGDPVDAGTYLQLRGTGIDNAGIDSISMTIDGNAQLLDASNSILWYAQDVGSVAISVTAVDTSGLTHTHTANLTIADPAIRNAPFPTDPNLPNHPGFDPSDTGTPTIEITSPEPASTVSTIVPIIGTVDDPEDNLWFYRVYYARADRVDLTALDMQDLDWVLLKTSTTEVINGELAVFDSSLVSNDPYTIAVEAFDVNGRGYIQPTIVYVEGNVQVGNFSVDITDLSIPVAGIPIQVTRTYDTHNALDEGDFGFGWSLAISDPRIFEAAAVGAGGAFTPGNDKFVPGKTKVYLTNPSGQRVGFTYHEEFQVGGLFGSIFRPYFVSDAGVYDRLEIDETQVIRGLIGGDFGQGINPEHYTLITKEGTSYRYSDVNGLETVQDRSGNVLSITAAGMRHSSGQSIEFRRDALGRITSISDPSGNAVRYTYTAEGDLDTVTNQADLETRYSYRTDRPHYLHEAYDSLGKRVLEVQYDEQGKFVGVVDALGNLSQQEFDTSAGSGVVRDALGNATTLYYDERGNVLREVDAQGTTTIREYADLNNPDLETKIVDRNGNVTQRTYDVRGNLLSVSERGPDTNPLAEPVETSFLYDAENNVQAITNASGHTTVFVYDSNGQLITVTNPQGHSSHFTYGDQGRRASFADFNGNVTRFEYEDSCPCGSPSRVIYADGTYQTYQYNQFGQVTLDQTFEADGMLVEQMQTFYDASGRETRQVIGGGDDPKHPATDVRKFYNGHLLEWEIIVSPESLAADGTLLESPATPIAQRKSRITEYQYDERDKLITQIDAMGGVVDFRYDAQGNRVLLRDPVGNITTWTYDSLNRVAEERDPFYWVDFVGANSSLSSDELLAAVVEENKKPSTASLATNQGAPHVRSFAYDAEGNQSKTIDRNNRRREFTYDHAGRLLEERWYNPIDHATAPGALVETINFTYDTLGNMLTAVDSNSRYLHTYDILNRLTIVDNNPLGDREVPRVILSYGYDAQGNVISTSDDAGVTVASEYDSRNRLAIRRWFDADVPDGETRDVDPIRVEFDYNAAGRESQVRRYAGLDTSNLVGRTLRTYDSVGRSNLLNHVNAADEILSSYDYDYDFGSLLIHEERTHQDAQYSQSIDYGYDLTGQLVDAFFSGQADEHFEYDPNGNRAGGDYETDPANQLSQGNGFRYEYDDEGNLAMKIEVKLDGSDGEVIVYEYDYRSRLSRIEQWSSDPRLQGVLLSSVTYKYDVFGRRIEKAINTVEVNNGVPIVSHLIYSGENSWADIDSQGLVTDKYILGDRIDQILSRQQPGKEVGWYLADLQGSIRDLTDANGVISNHVEYEVFGNILMESNETIKHRFRFQSREFDTEVGLHYYRARHYDAIVGRFLSVDPLGFSAGDSNFYRIVNNSLTNGVDPLGLSAISNLQLHLALATVGIVGGVVVGDFWIDDVCGISVSEPTRNLVRVAFGASIIGGSMYYLFLVSAGGFTLANTAVAPTVIAVGHAWTPTPSANELFCRGVKFLDDTFM